VQQATRDATSHATSEPRFDACVPNVHSYVPVYQLYTQASASLLVYVKSLFFRCTVVSPFKKFSARSLQTFAFDRCHAGDLRDDFFATLYIGSGLDLSKNHAAPGSELHGVDGERGVWRRCENPCRVKPRRKSSSTCMGFEQFVMLAGKDLRL
jgi:hypothetical protein